MKTERRERAGLALILVLYLGLAALFATLTPAWQAPDEPAHYNYVRYLAEKTPFPCCTWATIRTPIWKRSSHASSRPI